MLSDEQLVAKCLAGEQDAFEELLERYKGYVFAIIYNFISDDAEAEDVAQEVFLQIYRSLPRCQLKNFKAWIGRIAVNKAIDYRRKVKRLPVIAPDVEENETAQECEGASPEELYMAEESRREVRDAAHRLPEIYRNAIIKHYFHGKSCSEIAREEGISAKAVESRLSRARALFKKRWRREEG
ncbi:MAG: sigma-70 family RNA polymerase sigma factor [Bacillota bacterium]